MSTHSIHAIPHSTVKRQLIVKKITETPDNKTLYKSAISSLFENPANFFETTYKGKEVVVGKKQQTNNNIIQLALTPRMKRKSMLQNIKSRGSSINRMNSSSFLNRSTLSNKNNNTITKELPPNQQYVDDQELKKIFDDYRIIQQRNLTTTMSSKNILRYTDPKIKNELNQIFDLQENTLKTFNIESKGSEKIMNYLSQKLKKSASELLMNKVGNYRIKTEMINQFDEEIKNKRPIPYNQWELSLRYSQDQVNRNYINVGSAKYPKWQLILQKPNQMKEIVRNPKYCDNNLEIKEINNYLNNGYLQSKIPSSTYSSFKNTLNKNNLFSLEVKGRDLLQFEQDNAKMMKGKKIMSTPSYSKDMRKSIILGRDVNLPVLIKAK